MSSPDLPASDPPEVAEGAERVLRRDARRNRATLVATARAAFTSSDGVPLERIARDAGVGIGTLYRHFPTRESLAEAVYSLELDEVTASAETLLRQVPPDAALQAWMSSYAGFIAAKRGMRDTLRAAAAAGRLSVPRTRERITAAVRLILAAGARAGSLRGDVDADDVTALLLGVSLSTLDDSDPTRADRLLELVVDALRPVRTPGAGPR